MNAEVESEFAANPDTPLLEKVKSWPYRLFFSIHTHVTMSLIIAAIQWNYIWTPFALAAFVLSCLLICCPCICIGICCQLIDIFDKEKRIDVTPEKEERSEAISNKEEKSKVIPDTEERSEAISDKEERSAAVSVKEEKSEAISGREEMSEAISDRQDISEATSEVISDREGRLEAIPDNDVTPGSISDRNERSKTISEREERSKMSLTEDVYKKIGLWGMTVFNNALVLAGIAIMVNFYKETWIWNLWADGYKLSKVAIVSNGYFNIVLGICISSGIISIPFLYFQGKKSEQEEQAKIDRSTQT